MKPPILDLTQLEELLKQDAELDGSFSSNGDNDSSSSSSSAQTSWVASEAEETTLFCEDSSSEYSDFEEEEMTDQDECGTPVDGHVHFSLSHNQVYPHLDRASYTEQEYLDTWYSDDEYLSFSNEIIALSVKLSRGNLIQESDRQTARGLEAKICTEKHIRHRRRRDLLQSVLGEYEKQSWQGVFDQQKLCKESQRHSAASVTEAVRVGHEDELVLRVFWKPEGNNSDDDDKWESHCQSHDHAPAMLYRRASLNASNSAQQLKTNAVEIGLTRRLSPTSVTYIEHTKN